MSERVHTVLQSTSSATGDVIGKTQSYIRRYYAAAGHWGQKDVVGDIDKHRQINARDYEAYKRIFIRIVAHCLS